MQEVESKIYTFVVDNFLFGQGSLDKSQSFIESGIIDSTGVLELVSFIENEYDLAMADDELIPDNLDSVEKIASYIHRKRIS